MNVMLRRLFEAQRAVNDAMAALDVCRSPYVLDLARYELVRGVMVGGCLSPEALQGRAHAAVKRATKRAALRALRASKSDRAHPSAPEEVACAARATRRATRQRIFGVDPLVETRLSLSELRCLLRILRFFEDS